MYRDNVRNIHARACRGIHAGVIIFEFPTDTKLIHFHRISKNGGGIEGGSSEHPEPKLDPQLLIETSMYMYANAQAFWLHLT